MQKLWGMIILGFGISAAINAGESVDQWKHIIAATKSLTNDTEMKHALGKVAVEVQKTLSLAVKKVANRVNSAEKDHIRLMLKLMKSIVDKFEVVIKVGNFNDIDAKSKEEINQLGQELTILLMPLLYLAQDPQFVQDQFGSQDWLKNMNVQVYNGVKKSIAQLNRDVQ